VIELTSGARTTARLPDSELSNQQITIAIRPEYARFSEDQSALLNGRVENLLYSGTDTQYRVQIDDGTTFLVSDETDSLSIGSRVGVSFDDNVAQILKD